MANDEFPNSKSPMNAQNPDDRPAACVLFGRRMAPRCVGSRGLEPPGDWMGSFINTDERQFRLIKLVENFLRVLALAGRKSAGPGDAMGRIWNGGTIIMMRFNIF